MKVREKKIIRRLEVSFNRGRLEEQANKNFSRLVIRASSGDYDYSNWTDVDLGDLAERITTFLKLKNEAGLEEGCNGH